MAIPNRAAIITNTGKVLKKHYKPVAPVGERTVLEHLLYACCLENARFEAADECFGRLQESFFDWNEVRVTSVHELAEILRGLPNPIAAATNLKHTLHSVFESIYSFDMELLKKQNMGASVKQLSGYRGVTPFMVAYVTQHALGGHSIPICEGSLKVMHLVGAISDAELQKKTVPGAERAIPKSKGVEFASLLHQIGADFFASPFNPAVRSVLIEISPDAKSRLPKRRTSKRTASDDAAEAKGKKSKASVKKGNVTKKKATSGQGSTKKKKPKTIVQKAAKAKKTASKQLARRKPR